MLHPDRLAQGRRRPPGYVPGRCHPVGGEERIGAHQAVVDGEFRALEPGGGRYHPDPHHHQVGVEAGPVGQVDLHRRPTTGAGGQVVDADAGTQGHPPGPVQLGTGFAHPVTQHAAERGGQGLHHRHRRPQALTGGGHLGTNEPGPDDHHPGPVAGGHQIGPDRPGIVDRPEQVDVVDVLTVGPGSGPRPGGDDQAVVADLPPVAQQGAGLGIERGGPLSEQELETETVELVRGVVVDTGLVPLTGQKLLRQRRSVVGGMHLVAHDHHLAGVAQVADLFGRPHPGQ